MGDRRILPPALGRHASDIQQISQSLILQLIQGLQMDLLPLIPDNVGEMLVKIVRFTELRRALLERNLRDVQVPDFTPTDMPVAAEPDSSILLLNSSQVPGRQAQEILGLVQGHTVFAIWLGKDLSALIRLVLGGEFN